MPLKHRTYRSLQMQMIGLRSTDCFFFFFFKALTPDSSPSLLSFRFNVANKILMAAWADKKKKWEAASIRQANELKVINKIKSRSYSRSSINFIYNKAVGLFIGSQDGLHLCCGINPFLEELCTAVITKKRIALSACECQHLYVDISTSRFITIRACILLPSVDFYYIVTSMLCDNMC